MSIKLQLPKLTDLRPRITVIGVGGAGGNALNNMISSGLTGVEFVAANTDAQALAMSAAEHHIQLGVTLTEGLGAGSKPEIGQAAAEEAVDEIRQQLSGSHMCFVAAGMGGGTGTGAAAVIARIAKELGILTVGVVTKPFQFEGGRRMRMAEGGIAELRKHVDTLIVIPNQNLFRIATERTTFADAFLLADQVLHSGVACIVDLIVREGLINLDFADVRTVMANMGNAMMGTGEGSGERRAIQAAEAAIHNPLIDDISLKGAKGLLLSVTGGRDLTLYEVDEAASRVRQEVDPDANIIVGATFDDDLKDKVRVSIVASGITRAGEVLPQPSAGSAETRHPHPVQTGSGALGANNDSLKQRLSHAMQAGGASPAAGTTVRSTFASGAPDDAPLDLGEDIAPDAVSSAGNESQVWRGPGDVSIVEGMPRLAQATAPLSSLEVARNDPASRSHGGAVPQAGAPVFRPAPPADVRTAGRRMPDVSDFPPVGQREYHAKAQSTGKSGSSESATLATGRRPGFFERWTNSLSRRSGESVAQGGASDSSYDITSIKPEVAQANFGAAFTGGAQPTDTRLAGGGFSGQRQPSAGLNPLGGNDRQEAEYAHKNKIGGT